MSILQFNINLLESKPPVWRRIQVTDDFRFDRFHQAIQIAMGWENYHLHEFNIRGRRIGMVLNLKDGYIEPEDEIKLYLRDLNLEPGDSMQYLYDFGDSWQHLIELESISDGELEAPYCVDGNGHCPMEDSGGIGGYRYMLDVLKDPNHPERYEFWGDEPPEEFDPTYFPIKEVNAELARFGAWHRRHPRVKSTPWHQI